MFDENTINLLNKWAGAGEAGVKPALRLLRDLIFFRPDPQEEEKIARRAQDPTDWTTSLEPQPPFQDHEYAAILERGVRPLAQASPLSTASVLIEAAARMVALETGRDPDATDVQRNDSSEVWAPQLDHQTRPYSDSKGDLICTLIFACEQVYERRDRNDIEQLDRRLRDAKWYLLDRVRHHLYGKYPGVTEKWIREEILRYPKYAEDTYGFEFQRMVRSAAEVLGEKLLPTNELQPIFETVLRAPDKEDYRQFMAERFTEDGYRRRQDYFQLRQLRPFASVLFGKYAERYRALIAAGRELEDDDFIRFGVGESKTGASRSPKSLPELTALNDDELISFLNEWEDVGPDSEHWWVDIDFTGLATAFRQLIKNDPDRFTEWGERWQMLERPIYVRSALETGAERLAQNQSEIAIWLDLADWIMSRSDSVGDDSQKPSEDSREHPSWNSARRQAVDFVAACIGKDVNIGVDWRSRIFAVLKTACVAPDYYLDEDRPVITPRDYLTDAINTTRGRALEALLQYGFWLRRNDANAETSEVFGVLESRFAGCPALAIAEHALLGAHFHQLYDLSALGETKVASKIFPQESTDRWSGGFTTYLRWNRAHAAVFEIVKPHFDFALQNLRLLREEKNTRNDSVAALGQHLLDYFILGLIDLDNSLLERFYSKTTPQHWAGLFDHVGRLLSKTPVLKPDISTRIKAFFESRLAVGDGEELKEFTFWLKAECLEPEWRLNAFRQTLPHAKGRRDATSTVIDELAKLLGAAPNLVVQCFAELTEALVTQSYFYLRPERVKMILKAGFASSDPDSVQAARFARDNLLKAGRGEYRDLEAIKDDPHWLKD